MRTIRSVCWRTLAPPRPLFPCCCCRLVSRTRGRTVAEVLTLFQVPSSYVRSIFHFARARVPGLCKLASASTITTYAHRCKRGQSPQTKKAMWKVNKEEREQRARAKRESGSECSRLDPNAHSYSLPPPFCWNASRSTGVGALPGPSLSL